MAFSQIEQWCFSQMRHPMLFNWSRQLTNNSLSHPTYQLIYLHTYPPTMLQTYLIILLLFPTYHPTFLFINLFAYILINLLLSTYHPTYLFANLFTYIPTYFVLPTYILPISHLPFYILTYLPIYKYLPTYF
jgi:hypothetical protein